MVMLVEKERLLEPFVQPFSLVVVAFSLWCCSSDKFFQSHYQVEKDLPPRLYLVYIVKATR